MVPPTFGTEAFVVNRENQTFSQDASVLGFKPGHLPFGQIYPDACDVGLHLISSKTHVKSTWYLEEEQKNDDDVMGWKFKPTNETLRKNPGLTGWTLTVFND